MTTSFSLDKIKVNIEYQGRTISQQIAPYKTIKYLKELSKNLFYPIPEDIKLMYQNREISSFENNLLGDFFKQKNLISIKVIPISLNDKNSKNPKKNSIIKDIKSQFLCECKNDIIYHYCRVCKIFLCNSCRVNNEHLKHKGIQVDIDNINESAKAYAITLQCDIAYNISCTREYYLNFKKEKLVTPYIRHDIIQRKYDKLFTIYNDMIDVLEFNKYATSAENLISQYTLNTKQVNEDIDDILSAIYTKWTKPKIKMSFEEMKEIYEIISNKETELDELSSDIIAYRISNELNLKMDKIYDKIEAIIDEALNAHIPLGIEPNTYYLVEIIRKKKTKPVVKFYNKQGEEIEVKKKRSNALNKMVFKNRLVIESKEKDVNVNDLLKQKYIIDWKNNNTHFDEEIDLQQNARYYSPIKKGKNQQKKNQKEEEEIP